MLAHIIRNSIELCKFITALDIKLNAAQRQHVTDVADALIVSERRKKTLSALNRDLVQPSADEYALADCFRQSPWYAHDLRYKLLVFLLGFAIQLARQLGLEKLIQIVFDDSLCEKDVATRHLEAVDWHHDHHASTKKKAVYKNGSVYVLCRIQIGFIQFTLNWRLYLREQTVRRINRSRAKSERVRYVSKINLVREMLREIAPLLPDDFQVYVLFDSWYTAGKLLKFIHRQGWYTIGGLKSNRVLNGKQVRQWNKELRHQPYTRVTVKAADGTVKTYLVRALRGRLNDLPFEVCVLISKRHPRDSSPAYFVCTDLSLSPQQIIDKYGLRWPIEVDNYYLKVLLGLADYQMQRLEAIEKYHAVVFLALAYLQWRLARSLAEQRRGPLQTLADVIRLHREEHVVALLTAAAELALECGSVQTVLQFFLGSRQASAA